MKIVIRQAKIIDPASPHHQQIQDIFIEHGLIKKIGTAEDFSPDKEIRLVGLCVSQGWTDPFVHFCDPGFEARETLETGAAAAAAGGFTDVFVLPNTQPFVSGKGAVEYIVQSSKHLPVQVHSIGGITHNAEGKELTEMYDMHRSGAVAFSDGLQPLQNAGVLVKALQYLKAVDAVLIQMPDDASLGKNGLMHEGKMATQLGLAGKPALAEELMIARDIELALYTGSKLHITGVSTARGIDLIRSAKPQSNNITCSVTPYHLYFTDEALANYDSNFKVLPPLRTAADRDALKAAVLDGTVDCIASHHLPQTRDEKWVEFEYAGFGMIGLQTSFALVKTAIPQLSEERIVELFSLNARRIFKLFQNPIVESAPALLTLFQPEKQWAFTTAQNLSKSSNTPLFDKTLQGYAAGVIAKDNLFLNEE